ncbi:MAG TPA: serine hydrolase domain-containing protein [Chitinophagaceae bacterium]|nr:serine hydrolase domain-containing protein [Chitinophagaceae bacterium]
MKVTFVATFLLFFQPLFSQYNWSDLNRELESRQKQLGTDVVAMIWKGDSLVFKKEMGQFNSKTQAPIASCSKWLTAAMVMILVDEGKISLDDYVVKYIPEFGKYFKSYITIRQCLSHMTGIADDDKFLKKLFERKKYSTLEEEVNAFASKSIRANAGTDFWYGNIGLNIAGRILEVVTKRKFETLIKTKLFVPLGMNRTSFTNLSGGPVNPSGGAQSTADDYLKFLVMLLNKGKYNGKQILSSEAVEQMLEPQNRLDQVKYAPKAAEGYRYALGAWVMEEAPQLHSLKAKGKATALASPGLFGTWPMIDYCRGYAYIVFVKDLLGEEKARIHEELKSIIDKQIPSVCR